MRELRCPAATLEQPVRDSWLGSQSRAKHLTQSPLGGRCSLTRLPQPVIPFAAELGSMNLRGDLWGSGLNYASLLQDWGNGSGTLPPVRAVPDRSVLPLLAGRRAPPPQGPRQVGSCASKGFPLVPLAMAQFVVQILQRLQIRPTSLVFANSCGHSRCAILAEIRLVSSAS